MLVPIIERETLTVLFTRRTAQLRRHSGQVSFPGGRAEPEDASPEFTALRETHEEIGLPPERVEVLARMPEYLTRTGYRVTPVIGLIVPPLELVPDSREVDEVFEVPLAYVMDAAQMQRHSRDWQGVTRHYYAVTFGQRYIWGVTAGILRNLRERIWRE